MKKKRPPRPLSHLLPKGGSLPVHGHSAGGKLTPTYSTWRHMIERCLCPRSDHYKWYGARGILVCARWRRFENFLADMGERPIGKSLDRINNAGDYKRNNCRWATHAEQAQNASFTKLNPTSVQVIRRLLKSGLTNKRIGLLFGVAKSTIQFIRSGKTWANV